MCDSVRPESSSSVYICFVSSMVRVEYTKAVSLRCALPVVGLTEGDDRRGEKRATRVEEVCGVVRPER